MWDLSTILNSKIDNTTLVIAKTFNEISSKIIEFLSAIEEFQKWIFESKKKVLVSEYCITLDKIGESFYDEILANKEQIQEWKNLWFISDEKVLNKEYLRQNQTLNIDTKFFSKDFKDRLLNTFEDLEEETNGILINSENFQALNLLKNKYRWKVKCIYIDPPYNTWWDWFVYKDSFKHSSWLSMMQNRLELAKEFLSDDWVIFVSIDDNEQDNLKKLMDEVFGGENFVANISRKTRGSATTKSDAELQKLNDFVLCYWKDKTIWKFKLKNVWEKTYPYEDERWIFYIVQLQDNWPHWTRTARPNLYYPIYQNEKWEFSLEKNNENDKTYLPNKHKNDEWCWMWSPKKFKTDCNDLFIKNDKVYIKHYFNEEEDQNKYQREKNWIDNFLNTKWTLTLNKYFIEKWIFSNPKPVELIDMFLKLSTKEDSITLDFFSWSWTTQHAVIELNKEDNWNRKYIWVEMWEYFDTIIKPRVQKVIYTSNWKNWLPQDNKWVSQIMKYQVLEQYEDMLDKLEIDNEAFPEWLDLKYLYKKEEIKLKSTLNLRKPFENNYIYGKAKKQTQIDLIETYNYAKGNTIESIKTFDIGWKYYKCVKTWNTLQIWRGIEVWENDLENIKKIVAKFSDIEVLEVNVEIYSLERNKFGMIEINGNNYDVQIINESLFNE